MSEKENCCCGRLSTPLELIEIVRVTYDFEYARQQGMLAAEAMYPELSQEGLNDMAAVVMSGFSFKDEHVQQLSQWDIDEVEALVRLYDSHFVQVNNDISHYVMVDELLLSAAKEVYSRSMDANVPDWFNRSYVKKFSDIHEKVQSISLDLN